MDGFDVSCCGFDLWYVSEKGLVGGDGIRFLGAEVGGSGEERVAGV